MKEIDSQRFAECCLLRLRIFQRICSEGGKVTSRAIIAIRASTDIDIAISKILTELDACYFQISGMAQSLK